MPPPKIKKELQAFLDIINYLGKISPSTASICEPPQKLMSKQSSMDMECFISGPIQQDKSWIKEDVCIKFYDKTKPLHLETDASCIGPGAPLLQTRDDMTCPKDTSPDNTILRPIAFAIKSLTSEEWRYSIFEREALGILLGLKQFHHCCFAREVSIITNHKPLVAIFKKT